MNSSNSKNLENLYLAGFFTLGIIPIIPFFLKPYALVFFLLISIYSFFQINKSQINYQLIAINSSFFLVFALSYFYSENKVEATNHIIRLLPFLIFPLSFAMVPKSMFEKLKNLFYKTFIYSCGVFSVLIIIYCISLNFNDLGPIYSHLQYEFWGYKEHPIYISLYLGIAIILISSNKNRNFIEVFLVFLFLFILLFLTRKGNIISLFIVCLISLIWNYKIIFKKSNFKYLIVFFGILGLALFLFDNFIISRFQEFFSQNQWNDTTTSTGIRNIVLQIGLEMAWEQPVFGYGIGDVQETINQKLIFYGYEDLTKIHIYNAHNQYLQTLLTSGLLGLTVFLGLILYNLWLIIKSKSKIALAIFLYIICCFFFESMLERQNGIIIFALFMNLFAFFYTSRQNSSENI